MAENTDFFPSPPEDVFAVLVDGPLYGHWVVGSKAVRAVDPGWPGAGSRLHHVVGWGPFELRDHTEAVVCVPDRRLVLHAKARPLGIAEVVLELEPEGSGTRVRMQEYPISGLQSTFHNPLLDLAIRLRNAESMRRLRRLAEAKARARVADGSSAP